MKRIVTIKYAYEYIYDKYNLIEMKIVNESDNFNFLDLIVRKNDYNNRGYDISIWRKNQKGDVETHIGLPKSFINNASIYDLLKPSGPIILNKDSKSELIRQNDEGYSFLANIGDKIIDISFFEDAGDVILAYYPNSNTIFAHNLQPVDSVFKINKISDYFEKHIITNNCIISEYGCYDNDRVCKYIDNSYKTIDLENYHYIDNMFDIVPHYICKNYLSYNDDSTTINDTPVSLFASPEVLYSYHDIFVDILFPDYSFKGYKYTFKSFNNRPENIIKTLDFEIEVLSNE